MDKIKKKVPNIITGSRIVSSIIAVAHIYTEISGQIRYGRKIQ